MKKREITNNDLEQLFNKVINQTPLMNEDQVNSLLVNPLKAPLGSTAKQFYQNFLNSLIISSVVLSIIVGAILWVNSDHKTEKKSKQGNEVALVLTDTIADISTVGIDNENVTNDIALKIRTGKISSVPVQTEAIISVSDIYKHLDKEAQMFSIQANRDTTIICNEGTTIKIKANSFVSEKTGKEITGYVQVEVKEYYKLSDIVLSNLSTTSEDKIIETGGMLYISAISGNEKCKIKQGLNFELGFPYSGKKEGMMLFLGEWVKDRINWRPTVTFPAATSRNQSELMVSDDEVVQTSVTIEEVFVFVEEMPEFPGGVKALKKYIEQNTQYPFTALKNKIEGKVYVNFVVDKFGSVNNIRVTRGLNNALDKAAVYLVSQMPTWKPGKQRGKGVAVSYTVPVDFALKDSVLTDEEIRQSKVLEEKINDLKYDSGTRSYIIENKFIKEFEKKVEKDNLQETSIYDVNRYVFSVSQLGWINCDRFNDTNTPKTNYSILIDEPEKTIVNVIFHRFKSILPGCVESNRITFKNVPLGENITIVAIKTVNNKMFLAIKETVIADKEETLLDFQPVTMNLLKKEMKKLDKFN